ncbi:MAG: porin family protein [Nitrospira sp. CG24C]|nr:MAG: porin family protein [Nitrospira sp. CG24C]TKB53462.1 MAG: porin family protein [Nitrospira sp.]
MTQGWTRSRNIGRWCTAVAIAAGLAVCGVLPASADDSTTGNRVFFRGGFAGLNSDRGGEVFTDVFGASGRNDRTSGYYIGAGTDLMLTRDLWGMMNGIAVVGEIGVEFKRFGSKTVLEAVPSTCAAAGVPTCSVRTNTVQVTMLTVDVAPKIKFRQGTDFQPWVIPVGLDFHVISPPSNASSYLDIGIQFGAGLEYRIWKELWLGVDGRYHLASNQTSTVNNFGTIGSYVAIGF